MTIISHWQLGEIGEDDLPDFTDLPMGRLIREMKIIGGTRMTPMLGTIDMAYILNISFLT